MTDILLKLTCIRKTRRLPYLLQLAELESSRAGKTGMEVGSVRERIIVALLIYKFGEANVETEIPITEPEVDAKLFEEPASIKTIRGFYYIPLATQKRLFDKIGRENYIKLPKPGTNPRGVEITKSALSSLVEDSTSRRIVINWQKQRLNSIPIKDGLIFGGRTK
ncbi:MAG: ThaI family type II restriction endonuclease [bacterium]